MIEIFYMPQTSRALFDVCDMNGSILYTGTVPEDGEIRLKDFKPGKYVVWIIDGDASERIHVEV